MPSRLNGTATSGSFSWTNYMSYSKGHNQANFSVETAVNQTFDTVNIATTPQYRHRIDEVQISNNGGTYGLLDSAQIEPDGILLLTLKVTSIPTITGGSPNSPFILMGDLHYQSTGIGTKNKAPNFYT